MQYVQLYHCIKQIPMHATVHVDEFNMLVWQPTSPSGPRVGGVSTHITIDSAMQKLFYNTIMLDAPTG